MTRADALGLRNARVAMEHATVYLLSDSGSPVGVEQWRHDSAVIRDALHQLLDHYHGLFLQAERVLRVFDSDRGD